MNNLSNIANFTNLTKACTVNAILEVFSTVYHNRNKAFDIIETVDVCNIQETIDSTCLFANEDFAEIEYEWVHA